MIQSVIRGFACSLIFVLLCHDGAAQETAQANQLQPTASVVDLESVIKLVDGLGEPPYRKKWLAAWNKLLLDRAKIDRDQAGNPNHQSLVEEFLTSPAYRDAWKAAWQRAYESARVGELDLWRTVSVDMFTKLPSDEWINAHLDDSEDEVRRTIDQLLESEEFVEHWRAFAHPQFTARLLWIKADWTKLENTAELEAELRDVLAKESLASPEFDAGRASVLQILFPRDKAVSYSAQKMASLSLWLEEHRLLQDSTDFDLPVREDFHWTPDRMQSTFVTQYESEAEQLGLPPLSAPDPYTKQRNILRWTIRSINTSEEFRLWSGFQSQQLLRGQTDWQDRSGADTFYSYSAPDGYISIVHATSIFGDRGVVPLLLIDRTSGARPADVEAALVLPDRVSQLNMQFQGGAVLRANNLMPRGETSSTPPEITSNEAAVPVAEADVEAVQVDLPALRGKYEATEKTAQELAMKSRELGSTSTDVANQLRAELRTAVAEAFGIRQQLQRAELAVFATRLNHLRTSLDGRDKLADEIIDRRVADLLNPQRQWDGGEPIEIDTPRDETADRSLLKQQIDVLQRRLASVNVLYTRDKTTLAELLQTHVALRDVQVQFAFSTDAKRKANQNALDALEELHELIATKFKGGTVSQADLLAVEAAVLECKRKATQGVPRAVDRR